MPQEAIGIVLDIGPSMNQAPPGGATSLHTALDAVNMILQRKVRAPGACWERGKGRAPGACWESHGHELGCTVGPAHFKHRVNSEQLNICVF